MDNRILDEVEAAFGQELDLLGDNLGALETAVQSKLRQLGKGLLQRLLGREHHEYQLYLALEDIDHSKTRAKRPLSNGICERFHKTMLQEFYQVAFRKKLYNTLDELREDLDDWIKEYNEQRPHSGQYCFGKTPMQTFLG